jgi:hypothetical protein
MENYQTYDEYMQKCRPGIDLYLKKATLNLISCEMERPPRLLYPIRSPFKKTKGPATVPELLTAFRAGKLKINKPELLKKGSNLEKAYLEYIL